MLTTLNYQRFIKIVRDYNGYIEAPMSAIIVFDFKIQYLYRYIEKSPRSNQIKANI